jgi:hypothetical protein
MSAAGPGTRNDCAGVDQQQITGPIYRQWPCTVMHSAGPKQKFNQLFFHILALCVLATAGTGASALSRLSNRENLHKPKYRNLLSG